MIKDFIKNGAMQFLDEDYLFVLNPIFKSFCDLEQDTLNNFFKRNLQLFKHIQQLYIDNILLGWNSFIFSKKYNTSVKFGIINIIMDFIY